MWSFYELVIRFIGSSSSWTIILSHPQNSSLHFWRFLNCVFQSEEFSNVLENNVTNPWWNSSIWRVIKMLLFVWIRSALRHILFRGKLHIYFQWPTIAEIGLETEKRGLTYFPVVLDPLVRFDPLIWNLAPADWVSSTTSYQIVSLFILRMWIISGEPRLSIGAGIRDLERRTAEVPNILRSNINNIIDELRPIVERARTNTDNIMSVNNEGNVTLASWLNSQHTTNASPRDPNNPTTSSGIKLDHYYH